MRYRVCVPDGGGPDAVFIWPLSPRLSSEYSASPFKPIQGKSRHL